MSKENIPEFQFALGNQGSNVFSIEKIEADVGYDASAPHRHNYYEIFVFAKGGGMHMIDFQEWEINDLDVHVLSPGQVHYMSRDPSSCGWVLKFSPEFFYPSQSTANSGQHLIKDLTLSGNTKIALSENAFSDIMYMVDEIGNEANSKALSQNELIRNYLNLMLIKISRTIESTGNRNELRGNSIAKQFKNELDKSFTVSHRVSHYCDTLGITDSKLNQTLKNSYGLSTSEMISNRLLLEAKRFLLHSELSIKEIGFSLGFEDYPYFNRWFKKMQGCTPGSFKNESKEKYNKKRA
jgi:AraC family transcriptional regulator, transcriptional activator of pobA